MYNPNKCLTIVICLSMYLTAVMSSAAQSKYYCNEIFLTLPEVSQQNEMAFAEVRKVSAAILQQGQPPWTFLDLDLTLTKAKPAGENLPETLDTQSAFSQQVQSHNGIFLQKTSEQAILERQQASSSIYNEYLLQGPEVHSQVPIYINEDVIKSERTIRMTFKSNGEVIAHSQVQISDSAVHPLNFEDHFLELSQMIRTENDKNAPISEGGRFWILKGNKATVPENQQLLKNIVARKFIFYRIWSELLSIYQTQFSNVPFYIQVNDAMLKVLKLSFSPFKFQNIYSVNLRSGLPSEWVIKLNADEIQYLIRLSVKNWVKILVKQYLDWSPDPTTYLTFSVSSYIQSDLNELGVYNAFEKSLQEQSYNYLRSLGDRTWFNHEQASQVFWDHTLVPGYQEAVQQTRSAEHFIRLSHGQAQILLRLLEEQP